MTLQAAFKTIRNSIVSLTEAIMQFSSEAFDAPTLKALKEIVEKGVDVFGEPLHLNKDVEPDRVIQCLSQKPMRCMQIAVRTQTRPESVTVALSMLMRMGEVKQDEEAFYSLAGAHA